LVVVSWNMHGGEGHLGALLDDLLQGSLSQKPVRDVVLLLQEAAGDGARDVRAFASARGLSVVFGEVHGGGGGPDDGEGPVIGNAIVSTLPLDEGRVIDLPRERQRRAAVIAKVVVGGRTLFVGSTHLENRLGWLRGLFGDKARGRQARALLRSLPPTAPGIIGGDMNTMLGPEEPAWRAFLERFPETPESSQPTFRERLVLDHLFFDLPEGWQATQQVVASRYGSDHHPVLGLVSRTTAD
jgi:endonuclease/exonuclease/phosphatase family metal-dependent hydrolase